MMEKENKKPGVTLPSIKTPAAQQRFSSWKPSEASEEPLDKHLSELDDLLQDELLSPSKTDLVIEKEDSIDLENSDELNKIINKYEASLSKKSSGSGEVISESMEKERNEVERQL